MIMHGTIRELATFESSQGDALTFYFQPVRPQDKSHREEAILVKDLVRNAIRDAEKHGKNGHVRADLERIMELAERLHGNQRRAKAVFACRSKSLWRELDLPPRLPGTRLHINTRFHLKPLTALSHSLENVAIALVDRKLARLFQYHMEEITERENFVDDLPRRGRSDGWLGYDAGHVERKVANEAMQHFKKVADRLKEWCERAECSRLIIGCHDDAFSELERHLHPYVKGRLIGHFVTDPATVSAAEVKEHADRLLSEYENRHRQELMREVVAEAKANNRGALGLKRVLRSIEQGELQTLLLGKDFAAPGIVCPNCGHVDIRVVSNCRVCGRPTLEVADIADALVGRALSSGAEIIYVPADPELQNHGNIAALLRFRADRSTAEKLAS